jgi:hypothetical protein
MPSAGQKKVQVSTSTRKYSGDLANPIYEPTVGLLRVPWKPGAQERIREQQYAKLMSLFDWYKIDRKAANSWSRLAACLAIEHVPGMRVVAESGPAWGRRPSWKAGLGNELLRQVAVVQRDEACGFARAIAILRRQPQWRKYSQQNLLTRHREARRESKQRTIKSIKRNKLQSVAIKIFGPLREP